METPNIVVGQKIWLKPLSWLLIKQGTDYPLMEDKIVNIGTLYFFTAVLQSMINEVDDMGNLSLIDTKIKALTSGK